MCAGVFGHQNPPTTGPCLYDLLIMTDTWIELKELMSKYNIL